MTQRTVVIVKFAIWAACLAPFALLVARGFGLAGGLGVNPVEHVLDVCGTTGLNLLMLTLCVSPLRRSLGINRLVSFRRLLGLLGDTELRSVAVWKMEGWTNEEIAQQIGRSLPTVERKLRMIRGLWEKEVTP